MLKLECNNRDTTHISRYNLVSGLKYAIDSVPWRVAMTLISGPAALPDGSCVAMIVGPGGIQRSFDVIALIGPPVPSVVNLRASTSYAGESRLTARGSGGFKRPCSCTQHAASITTVTHGMDVLRTALTHAPAAS